MHWILQKRESIFSLGQAIAAAVVHSIAGIVLLFAGASAGTGVVSIVITIVALAVMFLVFAILWPDYRIGVIGVVSFWLAPAMTIAALMSSYYGLEMAIGILMAAGVAIAVCLPWSMLCITFAQLRLPVVYPPGHCQSCGYDLRGLDQARCPECGSMSESRKREAARGIASRLF